MTRIKGGKAFQKSSSPFVSVSGVQIRTLRPILSQHNLRLIHSGRLLTDGILLLSWLKALEARHHHQQHRAIGAEAGGGAGPEDKTTGSGGGENKVYLHCVVGLRVEEDPQQGAKGATAAKTADSEEVTEVSQPEGGPNIIA